MKIRAIVSTGLAAGVLLGLAARLGTAAPGRKGTQAGPGCIYGQVIDGHSGAVRCLSPEEVAPPGPYDAPGESADAGADAARDSGAIVPRRDGGWEASAVIPLRGAPFAVAIENLQFENGEVPRAASSLERIKKDFARCGAETSFAKSEATVELRFLVRAPGKAEGVDVAQSRGVSADIVRCITSSLAGRLIGSPTSDPVAVTVTVRFKRD